MCFRWILDGVEILFRCVCISKIKVSVSMSLSQILQLSQMLPSSASTSISTLAEVSFNLHFSTPPPTRLKSRESNFLGQTQTSEDI